MPNFGKRINQVVNERWDLPDGAASLMQLQADTLARIEAGDLGVAEGVLSRSEVTFETVGPVKQLRLGGCLLYGCKPDDTPSNLSTAAPVVYDPTDPNQTQSTVDITSLDGSEGAIWWSVALAPTDLANRRVWEAGYPDGRNQPILTRETPRVIFQTTSGANFDTPPATGGPWYRFAAVDFNASPPTVVLCHALDFGFEQHAFTIASGAWPDDYKYFYPGQIALDYVDPASNAGRSFSLARTVTTTAFALNATRDSNFEFDPVTLEITAPSELNLLFPLPEGGVANVGADLADLSNAVEVRTAVSALYVGYVTWSGSEYVGSTVKDAGALTVVVSSDAWSTTEKAIITAVSTVPNAYYIYDVVVTMAGSYPLSTGIPKFPAVAFSVALPNDSVFCDVGWWEKGSSSNNDFNATTTPFYFVVYGGPQ